MSRSRSPSPRAKDEPAAASASAAAPARPASPQQQEQMRPRLHMTGLPSEWDTRAAEVHFMQCGTVVDCVVFRDVNTNRAKYGFIEFDKQEDALKAIEQFDGKPLLDSPGLNLKYAKPKGHVLYSGAARGGAGGNKDSEPTRLFVGNIGSGATIEEVKAVFGEYGKIVDCSMWPNLKATLRADGSRAQSAFVEFEHGSEAKAAREACHLRPLLRGTEEAQAAAAKAKAEAAGETFNDTLYFYTPSLIVDYARPKYQDRDRAYAPSSRYDREYRPAPRDDYYRPRDRDYDRRDDYRRDDYRRDNRDYRRDDRDRDRRSSRYDDDDYHHRSSRYDDHRSHSRHSRSRSRSPPPRRYRDDRRSRSRSPRRDRR